MKIGTARRIAAEWVRKFAANKSSFRGAYFAGSTIELPEDAELPAASDVDVMIVLDEDAAPLKLGKFFYQDVLIEASYLSWKELVPVEQVMTSYHLANSFRRNTIIEDPTGHLHRLQKETASRFAEREWVLKRCGDAKQRIVSGLNSIDEAAPWHDQVTSWLFPTGVTTHVLLVAALKNPTIRLRYLAVRNVLNSYGQDAIYTDLLTLLGCEQLSSERVEMHLDELAFTYDKAASLAKTPFFFSSEITQETRQIAIDGSRELIRSGFHREAVFWIAAVYARCHKILAADASPEVQEALAPAFEALLEDLGIASSSDLLRRREKVFRFLPKLMDTAEAIMNENPFIQKGG